jgi:REP-associated tyrosine transposase
MAGTFSQLYVHIVFTVKYRKMLISPTWEEELYKYITGIVQRKGQKILAINGMPDHIHILVNIKPSCCISNLVREIKKSTSKLIDNKAFTDTNFEWQRGYGAFSHSLYSIDKIIEYISSQKIHHKKTSFKVEYEKLMIDFGIEYKKEFLFDNN